MGPKPLPKTVPVKAPTVAKKTVPAKAVPPATAKKVPPATAKNAVPAKPAPAEVKKKKVKKDDDQLNATLEAGRAQLDASLAAGRAQLDAGVAVLGSATANATEALQGMWSGLSWPTLPGGGDAPPPAPEKKKPVAAPAIKNPPPAKALPIVKKAAVEKVVPPKAVSSGTRIFGGLFGSSKNSETGSIDISQPRKRVPGKPPCTSAEELRKESMKIIDQKEETSLIAKRDLIVNAKNSSRVLEFSQVRPLGSLMHPSVTRRQMENDPRNTTMISEVALDPGLVTRGSYVDKVIESRQFVDVMKRSVNVARTRMEDIPSSSSRYLEPVEPDRPISPMQDNLATISFLPPTEGICEACGLYSQSCICETVKRITPYQRPNWNTLDRLLARVSNMNADDPDDERTNTRSVKGMQTQKMFNRP